MRGLALVAAALLLLAFRLPLWSLHLSAPQYPQGLHLKAYGDRIEGDLREINIINHYIGMPAIEEKPAPEMRLFPFLVGALLLLILASPLHRRLAQAAALATTATPLVILGDLQWWLYRFEHSLDPTAPLRPEPFTPLVLGNSTVGNFIAAGTLSSGLWCMLLAAAVLVAVLAAGRRPATSEASVKAGSEALAAGAALVLLAVPALADGEAGSHLQERLDGARQGSTVRVHGGLHRGPIHIRGPLSVVGQGQPVIDGGGEGSVVIIEGDGVTFAGFRIRGSGRTMSDEPAGIEVTGSGHRIEDNILEDVYFGIHLSNGHGNRVERNRIEPNPPTPGASRPDARPGHGISLWYVSDTRVAGNQIRNARDGVYLSFTERVEIEGNEVEDCRYGFHSMYSKGATLAANVLRRNLVGAALMYSEGLTIEGNLIERHRRGATAYGLLLKDISDVVVRDNRILFNRVGIYADGVPLGADREALVRGNLLAGNQTAFALQSNVHLTASGNSLIGNLTDIRAEGAGLSSLNRWSVTGSGNHSDRYQGYDGDGDGIGDLPYRIEGAIDRLLEKNPLARAFLHTPAHTALETAARLFPLYRADPLLIDEHPLTRSNLGSSREAAR